MGESHSTVRGSLAVVFFSELSTVSLSEHFPRGRFSLTVTIIFSDETSDKFDYE